MSRLVSGQKVELTDVSYRLQMSVSDWSWGVIAFKANTPTFLKPDESGLTADGDQLLINLEALDSAIERVIVYIYTDAAHDRNLEALNADLFSGSSNQLQYDILLEKESFSERALNFIELYQYKDKWKLSCVCQGFVEGLDRFLASYKLVKPSSQSSVSQSPVQSANPIINNNVNNGEAVIEMSWDMAEEGQHSPQKLYVGSQFNVVSDIRIGCFYQLRNGQVGITHSLDKSGVGSLIGVPYVEASREENRHFEKLDINLDYRHKLHRYLIFAYMLEGYSYWKAHNIKIEVKVDGVAATVITPDSLMVKPVYAGAMLEFDQGKTELTLLNDYFDHLPAMDQAYGWGLHWRDAD